MSCVVCESYAVQNEHFKCFNVNFRLLNNIYIYIYICAFGGVN